MTTSVALDDLLERIATLADLLDSLLVDVTEEPRPAWASCLLGATQELGSAARPRVTGEERLAHIEAAIERMGAAAEAVGDDVDARDGLRDAMAYAKEVRERAADVAAIVVVSARARAVEEARPVFRASHGAPEVISGWPLPAPDTLDKEQPFDPENEAARELAARPVGMATLQAWLAEDDAEAKPAARPGNPFAGGRGEPGEVEQLRRIARDCMEDLASLSSLRRADPARPWATGLHFEERLLASFDALRSLDSPRVTGGPMVGVASLLWSYLGEWSVPDPGRAFAFSLVLASCEDDVGARWVGLTMRRAAPRLAMAFGDAFALAAGAAVGRTLASLLQTETDAARLVAVLTAMRRRGAIEPVAVAPLVAHPDAMVAIAAIRALGQAASPVAEGVLADSLDEEPELAAEAAVSAARLGQRSGLSHARSVLQSGPDRAGERARTVLARLLAALGDPRDAALLAAEATRNPHVVELLGWHGHPSHGAWLIERLETSADEAARRAAAWGLTHLYGAPPDAIHLPSLDASSWRARAAALAPLAGARRIRHGALSEPADAARRVARELLDGATLAGHREILHLELELAAGRPVPIDLEGWVVPQQELLRAFG